MACGSSTDAHAHFQQALALHRELGDPYAEAATLDSIGCAHDRLGDHAQAVDYFERALDLQQSAGGYFYLRTLTLTHLGEARLAAGDAAAAREAWQQAVVILDELEHPDADALRARLAGLAGA
jgi:tetratricopeptide (TPR) repeat protein